MGLDITLVRITSCCSLCASAGKGETPGVQIRIKRRERSIYVFLCVFLRAASGSCGVRSRRGTDIPSCLSTENLSLSVLAPGRHEHILGRRGTTLWVSLLQVPHDPP